MSEFLHVTHQFKCENIIRNSEKSDIIFSLTLNSFFSLNLMENLLCNNSFCYKTIKLKKVREKNVNARNSKLKELFRFLNKKGD